MWNKSSRAHLICFKMLLFMCQLPENQSTSTNLPPSITNKTEIYRVAVTLQPPFVIKDENSPRGFQGYCIDLLDEIAKIQKFDYVIYEVKDQAFGFKNSKGEWNGIVRELLDKRADIGLPLAYVISERDAVVDFTTPLTDLSGLTILMKREFKSRSLFKFAEVLDWKVWLHIAVAFFSVSSLMWVIDRLSPYSFRYNPNNPMKETSGCSKFNASDCLWFCLLSLTPQGANKTSKSLSGKILMATWWLFGFIIIASYTANLAAFLTVHHLDKQIESLEDLSNQFKIRYSVLNALTVAAYFQRMSEIEDRINEIWKTISLNLSLTVSERSKYAVWDDPIGDKYVKLWRVIQEAGMPNTKNEAIDRVRQSTPDDGFAFLGDGDELRYLELMSCDLKTAGKDFALRIMAIPIQKRSARKELLDDAIFELMNRRFLDELHKKWWNREERNLECTEYDDEANKISVDNIGGLFILILAGISISVIMIVIEVSWFKYHKRRRIVPVMDRKRIQQYIQIHSRMMENL